MDKENVTGGGHGNPLQYSCLENPKDRKAWQAIVHRVAKSWTYIYGEILLGHKKEENIVICNKMDGPWGHYAKWNKSDIERQVLYDLTYTGNLKQKVNL